MIVQLFISISRFICFANGIVFMFLFLCVAKVEIRGVGVGAFNNDCWVGDSESGRDILQIVADSVCSSAQGHRLHSFTCF